MPLIDHFGLLAPFYERFIHPPQDIDWPSLLKISHSQSILDVGGGTGRVSQLISGNGHKIIVLDASLDMLGEAQAKGYLHPACGLSERIPFSQHTFDRILMVDAFHHLEDQVASGYELWRVLREGGRLVIEEPDIRQFAVKLIALGEKLLLMRSHFWQAERIASLFKDLPCQVQITRKNGSVWIIVDRDSDQLE
jgi:ubiquinone/menaquinone biosynthesis C-methylase UbiE